MTTSTWNNQPNSDLWNSADNWDPTEVPMTKAIFTHSTQTGISFTPGSNATVNTIEFIQDAAPFTFNFSASTSPALTITGSGIVNNSTNNQNFTVACATVGYQEPQLKFENCASAGGQNIFYTAGPETKESYGGGVISFCDTSNAGSAFFIAWTGAGAPPEHSTVGGEISFSDNASANTAHFTIYGTLGTDGDTFGNVVFHDNATAANAIFNNKGGTVPGGDGGNTQFYNNSNATNGLFYNLGGTAYGMVNDKNQGANGGDVAFDGTALGGNAKFYNYPATVDNAYGGVTSFNNNPPEVTSGGASADHGSYFNYGAQLSSLCGGGHLEFSAKHGSPTAGHANITNYGSEIASTDKSSAGHTIFSVDQPTCYFPTAGNATIYNQPGKVKGAPGGFTEFSVYQNDNATNCKADTNHVPTAGNGTFINLGANISGAGAGYTSFSGTSDAGNAYLIAHAGSNGGYGGKIAFYDDATGGNACVQLYGNGVLSLSYHNNSITLASLELTDGTIEIQLGTQVTNLILTEQLILKSEKGYFYFTGDITAGETYTVLTSPNLMNYSADQFSCNSLTAGQPYFSIANNSLRVSFN